MEYVDVWVSLLYDPLDYVLEHVRLCDSTSEEVHSSPKYLEMQQIEVTCNAIFLVATIKTMLN